MKTWWCSFAVITRRGLLTCTFTTTAVSLSPRRHPHVQEYIFVCTNIEWHREIELRSICIHINSSSRIYMATSRCLTEHRTTQIEEECTSPPLHVDAAGALRRVKTRIRVTRKKQNIFLSPYYCNCNGIKNESAAFRNTCLLSAAVYGNHSNNLWTRTSTLQRHTLVLSTTIYSDTTHSVQRWRPLHVEQQKRNTSSFSHFLFDNSLEYTSAQTQNTWVRAQETRRDISQERWRELGPPHTSLQSCLSMCHMLSIQLLQCKEAQINRKYVRWVGTANMSIRPFRGERTSTKRYTPPSLYTYERILPRTESVTGFHDRKKSCTLVWLVLHLRDRWQAWWRNTRTKRFSSWRTSGKRNPPGLLVHVTHSFG